MKHESSFSDETLNAFVDNQLLPIEKDRIYQELEHDKELSDYVCRLRTVHEMVQDAYAPPLLPAMKSGRMKQLAPWHFINVAAVLLLFIAGGLTGWFGHAQFQQTTTPTESAALHQTAAPLQPHSVLLHLSSGEPERIDAALRETERMLKQARQEAKPLLVEVLANDTGLNLLREDNSEFAARIAALQQEYGNVTFMACAKALQRMNEQGVHYDLVPEAQIVPSALDEIVKRMESGWVYIHV